MTRRRAVLAVLETVALAAVVFVGVSAWLVPRQARPASPDIGRVVGALQVRVDGPRDAPALVLLHGWSASLRWWDELTPALARGHRVVRVDLLGHGGSAKPRDGYTIEHQADLVAAVLARLGVRRAVVVGHSMGGVVAAALAERHRSMVARLMTIGTPSSHYDNGTALRFRLAFSPLVGPGLQGAVPDGAIRREYAEVVADRDWILDRAVADHDRIPFSALRESSLATRDFLRAAPLDARLRGARIPVLAVFGAEDDLLDGGQRERWLRVPGARVEILPGLNHSPHIERPALGARMILGFAR